MCSINLFPLSKTLAKYEEIGLLKSSNKTCFRNTIKTLLCSDVFRYVYNANTVITKIVYPCRGDCSKVYSSISNRNKHGKR